MTTNSNANERISFGENFQRKETENQWHGRLARALMISRNRPNAVQKKFDFR